MDAEFDFILHDLVQRLARAVAGGTASAWRDEHARWDLYRQAATIPQATELLRQVVEIEPVGSLASAAVVMMLERVIPSERIGWIEVLDPSVRSYPEVRARELGILEVVSSGVLRDGVNADTVEDWSDWLQRRVAESSGNRQILSVLADHARTKKIRRLAQEALDDKN